jgi:hypothetical protein
VPNTFCFRHDELNAVVDCDGLWLPQAIGKLMQFLLRERLELSAQEEASRLKMRSNV